MNTSLLKSMIVVLGLAAALPALAQESPWLVRARGVYIDPADKSDPLSGTGADVRLDDRWSFNVDLKKLRLRSDVTINGARASRVTLDPLLLGAGFGYRF